MEIESWIQEQFQKARLLCFTVLVVLAAAGSLRADSAAFDLVGPSVHAHVTRGYENPADFQRSQFTRWRQTLDSSGFSEHPIGALLADHRVPSRPNQSSTRELVHSSRDME